MTGLVWWRLEKRYDQMAKDDGVRIEKTEYRKTRHHTNKLECPIGAKDSMPMGALKAKDNFIIKRK